MGTSLKLRRIGILSAIKIGCAVSIVLGFIIGIAWGMVFIFFSSAIALALDRPVPGIGFAALVILPLIGTIVYGFLGTAFSFLFTLLFNLAAGILGGLEVEIDFIQKENTSDKYTGIEWEKSSG